MAQTFPTCNVFINCNFDLWLAYNKIPTVPQGSLAYRFSYNIKEGFVQELILSILFEFWLPYIRHCEPPLLLFGGEAIPSQFQIALGKTKNALAMAEFTRFCTVENLNSGFIYGLAKGLSKNNLNTLKYDNLVLKKSG
ncbi:MAG: hypothetical protein HY864_14890 [Chloroflexi bacterium]|nr:hypothetical protein [Chloroflexota bacterium]